MLNCRIQQDEEVGMPRTRGREKRYGRHDRNNKEEGWKERLGRNIKSQPPPPSRSAYCKRRSTVEVAKYEKEVAFGFHTKAHWLMIPTTKGTISIYNKTWILSHNKHLHSGISK